MVARKPSASRQQELELRAFRSICAGLVQKLQIPGVIEPWHQNWQCRLFFVKRQFDASQKADFFDRLKSNLALAFKELYLPFNLRLLEEKPLGGGTGLTYSDETRDHAWVLNDDSLILVQVRQRTSSLIEILPALLIAARRTMLPEAAKADSLWEYFRERTYGFSMSWAVRYRYEAAYLNRECLSRLFRSHGEDDFLNLAVGASRDSTRFPTLRRQDIHRCDLKLSFRDELDRLKKLNVVNSWLIIEAPANQENRYVDLELSIKSPDDSMWDLTTCLEIGRWAAFVEKLFGEFGLSSVLRWVQEVGPGAYEK